MKDIDVIGARSKGWPIKPGQEQARLVTSMVNGSSKVESRPPSSSNASVASTQFSNGEGKRRIKDPHSSLSLFEPAQSGPETPRPAPLPMRSSAKPAPRDYGDLFVGGDGDSTPQPLPSRGGSFAGGPPSAEKKSPMKAGSGKNFQPSRLFEEDDGAQAIPTKAGSSKNYKSSRLFEEDDGVQSIPAKAGSSKNFQPSRLFDGENGTQEDKKDPSIKPNPKKYEHFDFGEGLDENAKAKPASPVKNRASKHVSQWNFEDFATPEKPVQRVRGQDVRHFGWEDDEVDMNTPAQPKRVVQPRKDAETHFKFQDDGTPKGNETQPAMRPKGVSHNEGLGLYQNNVVREEGSSSAMKKNNSNNNMPLGNVTNMNNHRKNFGSHFTMTDNSPSSGGQPENKKPTTQGHEAAVKMMDSHWDQFDEGGDDEGNNTRTKVMGHDDEEKKENGDPNAIKSKRFSTGIKTAGDGMGGKNGLRRQWGIGDESEEEEEMIRKPKMDSRHMTSSASGEKSFWDF